MFVQLLANGLVTGSVIALAAAGVSIVYGILRLVNFAYGDYMTFGAFMGILFNVTLDLPIVPAAMLAMAATAVLSVALELVLWRPLRARSADKPLLSISKGTCSETGGSKRSPVRSCSTCPWRSSCRTA